MPDEPRTDNTVQMSPHASTGDEVLFHLQSSQHGLSHSEASVRLEHYGRNRLPETKPPSIGAIFLHQFSSPLIYVLAVAALLSAIIQEWSDAGFIVAVLLINSIIGTLQEHSAQRAAAALQNLVSTRCRVPMKIGL